MKTNEQIYDEQINRLTEHPGQIVSDWNHGVGLFRCFPHSGCLTTVKGRLTETSGSIELDNIIRADQRIPKHVYEITIECLPACKEMNMLADRMLNRPNIAERETQGVS